MTFRDPMSATKAVSTPKATSSPSSGTKQSPPQLGGKPPRKPGFRECIAEGESCLRRGNPIGRPRAPVSGAAHHQHHYSCAVPPHAAPSSPPVLAATESAPSINHRPEEPAWMCPNIPHSSTWALPPSKDLFDSLVVDVGAVETDLYTDEDASMPRQHTFPSTKRDQLGRQSPRFPVQQTMQGRKATGCQAPAEDVYPPTPFPRVLASTSIVSPHLPHHLSHGPTPARNSVPQSANIVRNGHHGHGAQGSLGGHSGMCADAATHETTSAGREGGQRRSSRTVSLPVFPCTSVYRDYGMHRAWANGPAPGTFQGASTPKGVLRTSSLGRMASRPTHPKKSVTFSERVLVVEF